MGTIELVIIVVILIFLFGGKKIPEFMRGASKAVREFKKSTKEEEQ